MRAIAAFLVLFAAVLQADEWNRSYSVGANPEVDVRVDDANVIVRSGAAGRVEARITSQGYEFRPGEVEIRDTQSGDRVEIEVKRARSNWNVSGDRWIRVELTVPPAVAAHVKTGDGNVEAVGLSGALRFATGDGNIIGDNLGGTLEARTGDGNIQVAGQFSAVTANTGDGNVEVRAAPASQMVSGWRFVTGDGDVRLSLPQGLRATVDVRTGDGRIDSELPLTGLRVSDKDRDDSELRGDLNGGGAVITIRTGDGNVVLNNSR